LRWCNIADLTRRFNPQIELKIMQIGIRQFQNDGMLQADNDGWFVIKERSLKKIILEAFSEPDKKNILTAVWPEPMIISDILNTCKIPHTSGYRKIRSLIREGLLVSTDKINQYGKMTKRYGSIIENLRIDVRRNRVSVRVKFSKELAKYSKFDDPTYAQAE